jgi:hypothetical protein
MLLVTIPSYLCVTNRRKERSMEQTSQEEQYNKLATIFQENIASVEIRLHPKKTYPIWRYGQVIGEDNQVFQQFNSEPIYVSDQRKVRGKKELKQKIRNVETTSPFDEKSFFQFIQTIRSDLSKLRESRLRQAHIAFTMTLVTIILGILLASSGVLCIYFFGFPIGGAQTLSGVISNITSFTTFRFSKEINTRLDTIIREISILDRAHTAMQFISMISDSTAKDTAITELARDLQSLFREDNHIP